MDELDDIQSAPTETRGTYGDSYPERPLRGLLIAQFFGAFNDNALKVFVAFLAMRSVVAAVGTPAYETASQTQTTLAFVALTLPLMIVSLPAAMIADVLTPAGELANGAQLVAFAAEHQLKIGSIADLVVPTRTTT